MKAIHKSTVLVAVCICILGDMACTSTNTLIASREAVVTHNIEPGDKLTLIYNDARETEMTLSKVGVNDLVGVDKNGEEVVADFAELYAVRFSEIDHEKSVNAVGIIALGALIAIGLNYDSIPPSY